jgi:hypothetical protein
MPVQLLEGRFIAAGGDSGNISAYNDFESMVAGDMTVASPANLKGETESGGATLSSARFLQRTGVDPAVPL